MSEKPRYAEGLYFNEPHPNAPDFVLGSISIRPNAFSAWMADNTDAVENGYLRLDVKKSKSGKVYVAISDWKPDASKAETRRREYNEDSDVPF